MNTALRSASWPLLALALFLSTVDRASASCALIPSAVKVIPSVDGAIDQPFAAPGDTVTIFSDGACKPEPSEPHFDLDPANNEITLIFEPPTGATPPPVPPFLSTAVGDCGNDRCFALEFQLPDTTGLAGAFPLTGPARIQVRNLASGGTLVAEIADLYEPAIGCNLENRARNLFVQFTVLPPPSVYDSVANATIQATVDGSGALLIPLDYSNVLPAANTNAATVRILEISADIPNGLSAGNGLSAPDSGLIRPPRKGRFVRSFSVNGRPLPPLLRVSASQPLNAGGIKYGDTIVGSVDFRNSVLRIARIGEHPDLPGTPLQIFALDGEQGQPGIALQDGVGPILLTGADLVAGAAAPLNSVNASADLAVVARDERLEQQFGTGEQNSDGDSDDRVVSFIALETNSETTTGQAVVELREPTPKAIVEAAGSSVAFFQSEARTNRTDLNNDSNAADAIVRAWNTDGSHPFCGGTPCDLTQGLPLITGTPALKMGNAGVPKALLFSGVADPGRYLFFTRSEALEATFATQRFSVDDAGGGELTGASFNSHVSADGQWIGFTSSSDDVVSGVSAGGFTQVYRRNPFFLTNDLVSADSLFGFTPGNGDSDNVYVSSNGASVAFDSFASNLVAGDTEGQRDVFVADNQVTFSMLRLSQTAGGAGGNGPSWLPRGNDSTVVFNSLASNFDPLDLNGKIDVYSSGGVTPERVSLTHDGGLANDDCENAGIDAFGDKIVFECAATNMVPGDTNGVRDIFVRSQNAGTTTRISVGYGGTEANGASTNPTISDDGRYIAFVSEATNLLGPGTTLNAAAQCYVYDTVKNSTQLVSMGLDGEGGDADCFAPYIDRLLGRYVTFASAATNLQDRIGTNQTIWIHDILVGVTAAIAIDTTTFVTSVDATGTRSSFGVGSGVAAYDALGTDFGVADSNGVSDVYGFTLPSGPSFNAGGLFADSDYNDQILYVFDTQTRSFINTEIPVQANNSVWVSAGRASIVLDPVNFSAPGFIWDQEAGGALNPVSGTASGTVAAMSISETSLCVVDAGAGGVLYTGDPSTGMVTASSVTTFSQPVAVGPFCVTKDPSGILNLTLSAANLVSLDTGHIAEDFSASEDGVAYRRCELAEGLDLNGDGDIGDECVMNYWDFATGEITETGHVAVQCTFPGCDPFFEPYRVGPGFVSFVTDETLEVDAGGSGGTGTSCLPNSPPGICDKTGDKDGDDVAIEIYSLVTGRAQVFPLKRELPPTVPPFPNVMEGATDSNVMILQLPAEVLGTDFDMLPPEQLVTVIVGDPDGDSVFEADGNTDALTTVVDKCQEIADPEQLDADGDGMAEGCDVTLTTGVPNDGPSSPEPAELPGEDLCDLNRSGKITRTEVNQIFADRGIPISPPKDHVLPLDGIPDATDNRDRDADGGITAVDFRLCLADCDAQLPNGCTLDEGGGGSSSGFACGLIGIETLLVLAPAAWRRRRRAMQVRAA